MIPIIFILCGLVAVIDAVLSKNKPKKREKLLSSKARKRKANLSDEEYLATVYKSSLFLGIVMIILGIIWIVVIG